MEGKKTRGFFLLSGTHEDEFRSIYCNCAAPYVRPRTQQSRKRSAKRGNASQCVEYS